MLFGLNDVIKQLVVRCFPSKISFFDFFYPPNYPQKTERGVQHLKIRVISEAIIPGSFIMRLLSNNEINFIIDIHFCCDGGITMFCRMLPPSPFFLCGRNRLYSC